MINKIRWAMCLLLPIAFVGCSGKKQAAVQVERPAFSSDSAYVFIQHQLSMGARVPGSKAHTECVLWLFDKMAEYSSYPELQTGNMVNYAGQEQQVFNVIGHFGSPSQTSRILLLAHYDCRPWCDEEMEYEDRFTPVPGANDGASGVAVLMEVARQLHYKLQSDSVLPVAVDIVFLDCEDMGTPSFYTGIQRENTWCLGSQMWAARYAERKANPKLPQDLPLPQYQFGVLLDMVGAPDAVFPKEYYSLQFAQNYVEKIWRAASGLGYGKYFIQQMSYPITDDHYYVNMAGIPCVDIIHYDPRNDSGFPSWWHTRQDDLFNIDKSTLQAVGEVIMEILK